MRFFESTAKYRKRAYREQEEEIKQGKAGFVVTIEGYSPYTNLGDLMDPYGVGNDADRWGVVTRLLHLADSNSPFELYEKTNPTHFKLDSDAVAADASMPDGVGMPELRSVNTRVPGSLYPPTGERLLIDPMTKETISKVKKPSGEEIENDHWFVLQLKFIWKDAPKAPPPPGL
ncbi:MAG: hypothetical protein ACYST6_07110 [Planctomycetota bacterium]